jgi:hypothetical protein
MENLKIIEITTKELQEFGFTFGAVFASLFGLILPWVFDNVFPLWPWCVFVFTYSLATMYPLGLKIFYKLWIMFGGMMGWINNRFILGVIFLFLFMPFGLVMRLFRKDLLSLKIDKKLISYRVDNNEHDKDNMEDPF